MSPQILAAWQETHAAVQLKLGDKLGIERASMARGLVLWGVFRDMVDESSLAIQFSAACLPAVWCTGDHASGQSNARAARDLHNSRAPGQASPRDPSGRFCVRVVTVVPNPKFSKADPQILVTERRGEERRQQRRVDAEVVYRNDLWKVGGMR